MVFFMKSLSLVKVGNIFNIVKSNLNKTGNLRSPPDYIGIYMNKMVCYTYTKTYLIVDIYRGSQK